MTALASGIFGLDRLKQAFATYIAELPREIAASDALLANAAVLAMRAKVHVDTGNLLNGITAWNDGRSWVIQASAVSPRGVQYAGFVEYGTKPGREGRSVADGRGRRRKQHRNHPGTKAQPYFWPVVKTVLKGRWERYETASARAAKKAGFETRPVPSAGSIVAAIGSQFASGLVEGLLEGAADQVADVDWFGGAS